MERERRIASGFVRGGLLDLDAALGAGDDVIALRRAVEDEAEVVLLRDLGGRRDEHGPHRHALDVETDDLARALRRLVGAAASFTPPALPRPPTRTCAFTTTGPPMRSAAARAAVGGRGGLAREQRHAVARKDLLAPILLELHAGLLLRNGASARDRRAP